MCSIKFLPGPSLGGFLNYGLEPGYGPILRPFEPVLPSAWLPAAADARCLCASSPSAQPTAPRCPSPRPSAATRTCPPAPSSCAAPPLETATRPPGTPPSLSPTSASRARSTTPDEAPDAGAADCPAGASLRWATDVASSVYSSPLVTDLFGDGSQQVVVPTFVHYLEALEARAELAAGRGRV